MANALEHAVHTGVFAARHDLNANGPLGTLAFRNLSVEAVAGQDGIWVVLRLPTGRGYALRAAPSWGMPISAHVSARTAGSLHLKAISDAGTFRIEICLQETLQDVLRVKTTFTPCANLSVPYAQRDLYILGDDNDPSRAKGKVLASQRGLNSGIIFLQREDPRDGSLLYFQNFTELNPYFRATQTTPDSSVGGDWPELGYQAPVCPENPLRESTTYVVSDVILAVQPDDEPCRNPSGCAEQFLTLLSGIYQCLPLPKTRFHDWPSRAAKTLKDLQCSDKAGTKAYGRHYVRPYVDAEYPDSMVQLAVLAPVRSWEKWEGCPIPFADELAKGLAHFYDEKLGSLRRYLPNVGKDKNADEVDSWYLYHPLSNLGRMALGGDQAAKELLLKSVDFGISAAHHFSYRWPVQFDVKNFAVIKENRKPGEPGQSDVGGLYAYVMLQAYELTEDPRFLKEAKAALNAIKNFHFQLLYQSNITSWGAAACAWLYEVTHERRFLEESFIFLANLFQNSSIWKSDIAFAKNYCTFFGVSCLHDGPYMAVYECYETFMALSEYLQRTWDELPPPVRHLVSEHVRYGPFRAWWFYPDALPAEALSPECRNGEIDRNLSFPVEDLYVDGRQAGTVGQEIYGCGAAFMFSTLSFHPLKSVPFSLYCEYPVSDLTESNGAITCRILGPESLTCRLRLILTKQSASTDDFEITGSRCQRVEKDFVEFRAKTGTLKLRIARVGS